MSSRDVIARAATIAVRCKQGASYGYSQARADRLSWSDCAVRRQFVDKDAPAQEARQVRRHFDGRKVLMQTR
jgi:hypothetical protein